MELTSSPIRYRPSGHTHELLKFLKSNDEISCLHDIPRVRLVNRYHHLGHKGTSPTMIARKSVYLKLKQATEILGKDYGFIIFDSYRSNETQLHLFQNIHNDIKRQHPQKSEEEILQLTRVYVAHPKERSRYAVSPHNSGGAVDLNLHKNNSPLDMGTKFDEISKLTCTTSFEAPHDPNSCIDKERWNEIRLNRRLLFNIMKSVGFVNYPEEWWHYDLGDCIWAAQSNSKWFYDSLEGKISNV